MCKDVLDDAVGCPSKRRATRWSERKRGPRLSTCRRREMPARGTDGGRVFILCQHTNAQHTNAETGVSSA